MIKFIYNWLQKFWNRVKITIIIILLIFMIVLLTYNSGSSDFSVDEFKPPLTVEKLCKVIVDGNYNIPIQAPINTINWLNEFLKVPNFYDILHVKKLNINFSKSITDLVDKTKNYRNKSFSDLNKDKQNTIKRLNRLLLEETYPQRETLKINDSKNFAFVKAWICVGNLVTLFISGFIVCYTINEVFIKTVQPMAKLIEWLLFVGLIVIVSLGCWGMSSVTQKYRIILELSPIALVFGMFSFDKWLVNKKSYFPRLYESRDFVRNFDLGIIIGLVVTIAISHIMEMMVGNVFAQGFSSGATAFQLIIANLIFDPCIYKFEFKLPDGMVNKE